MNEQEPPKGQSEGKDPHSAKEQGGLSSGNERFTAKSRRAFIAHQLRARGMLSLARLQKKRESESESPLSTSLSNNSLQGDIDYLNELGYSIKTVETDGRTYLVDAAARHLDAREHRVDLNARAKEAVARFACSMVLGLPDPDENSEARKRLERTNPELCELWSRSEVVKAIARCMPEKPNSEAPSRLTALLDRAWKEARINLFCDAGTTNERFANWLSDVLLPTAFSNLSTLHVCSNSRTIFNMIGDPEVPAMAVITGGSQLGIDGATESVAGELTDIFLKATQGILDFTFAFIGAVSIDGERGLALSDSAEEKRVKETLLAGIRSSIRVICVDRSKFRKKPLRSSFNFASICPEKMDLIITSAPLSGEGALSDSAEKEAADVIRTIRADFGVPVVEATLGPPATTASEIVHRETRRGKAFRVRMKFHKQEELFEAIGFESQPVYPSRAMEIWTNATADYLLSYDCPEGVREEIKSRVNKLRESVFMGVIREVDELE